jgi:CheY-like chemotaxis protein
VRTAADGIIALEQVADKRPDLILLDMMMPRMNGLTFLQHLRRTETGGDIPVIVLSNFKEPDLLRAALELGALEYLVKANTRPDALLSAMPYWIRGERAFTA